MAGKHHARSKGPGQGPAKGSGSTAPRQVLDTSPEKQRARAAKSVTLRERMRAWRLERERELGKDLSASRPLSVVEVRELAQSYAPDAFETLAAVVRDTTCSPAARVAAATALLDRGYGKPVQQIQQLDSQGNPADPITINILAAAADRLSTDELEVLSALFRKMGVRMPHEAPAQPE